MQERKEDMVNPDPRVAKFGGHCAGAPEQFRNRRTLGIGHLWVSVRRWRLIVKRPHYFALARCAGSATK